MTPTEEQRTLILTGASRGIGHATVKRFSSAGWRVITCSRHAFPENCPWAAGPEDHIQVDLADPDDTLRAVEEMRGRLKDGKLHALGELEGKPRLIWSLPLGRRVGEPVLTDLDGTGRPVILVTAEDGRLYCLKAKEKSD